MSEIGQRIREQRDARGWSQSRLAMAAKTTQQTVDRIERGETIHSRALPRILEALSIEPPSAPPAAGPGKVLTVGEIYAPGMLPIYGSAEGGDGELVLSFDPVDFVPMPAPLTNVKGAYGMFVTGDSMSPVYEPGDQLLIHPHKPARGNDDVVLWRTQNGETHVTVKRLLRATPDLWFLRRFSPVVMDFQLSRLEWPRCHLVIGKYSRQ